MVNIFTLGIEMVNNGICIGLNAGSKEDDFEVFGEFGKCRGGSRANFDTKLFQVLFLKFERKKKTSTRCVRIVHFVI